MSENCTPCGLLRIPDDVLCIMVEFATQSLRAVLSLQRINRHFYVVMRQPRMLWHVRARFNKFRDSQHLGVGLRHLSIPKSQTSLAPLASLCELRTLHMPSWRTHADVNVTLGHLTQLEELDLSQAERHTKLESLPTSLQRLNIRGTSIEQLPDLPNLEELDMSGRGMAVPRSPKLRSLKMVGSSLGVLDFRHLTELHDLDISDGKCTHFHVGLQLRVLIADSCRHLLGIPDLPNLTELNVMFCEQLEVLPQLPALTKLNNMYSHTCPNPSMGQLRELEASVLTFQHFECLSMCPRLEKLDLQGCDFVEQDFSNLTNLTWLSVELGDLVDLRCLPTSLTYLQLDRNVSDMDLIALPALTTLKKLHVTSGRVTNAGMMSIARIRGLEDLCVDNQSYWSLSSLGISYVQTLTNLRRLVLRHCAIDDLAVMSDLAQLEILSIRENVSQLIVEPLANCKKLKTLTLNGCTIESLRGLNQILRLSVLSIVSCRIELEEFSDLMPNQLTYLKLMPFSSQLGGQRLADFIAQLKASNPWMQIYSKT